MSRDIFNFLAYHIFPVYHNSIKMFHHPSKARIDENLTKSFSQTTMLYLLILCTYMHLISLQKLPDAVTFVH